MVYIRKDSYYKKAKKEGYNSRAIYKLLDIDKRYHLLDHAKIVLDIGASPGSWSQFLLDKVGSNGIVVAIDILDIKNIKAPNFIFIKANLFDNKLTDKLKNNFLFDVILSDAAPNTTGQKDVDHINSINIVERTFSIAKMLLKKNGNFLVKVFEGPYVKSFFNDIKDYFELTKIFRPPSTRKGSVEMYIIGKKFCTNEVGKNGFRTNTQAL